MLTLTEIKSICARHGIAPQKSKGQNFLVDQNIVQKMISAANLKEDDVVLEVGPGLGVMTAELIKVAQKVIAVELDKKLFSMLCHPRLMAGRWDPRLLPSFANDGIRGDDRKERGDDRKKSVADEERGGQENETPSGKLEIVCGDILKINPADLGLEDLGYRVVANLPYNITSIFLRRFLEAGAYPMEYPAKSGVRQKALFHRARPSEMILMVQKEVAQRIVAKAGEMSLLSLATQFYSEPKILFFVNRGCFWPEPAVDSAVISLKLKKNLPYSDEKQFFRLARVGFSAKRKQLQNNLSAGFHEKSNKFRELLASIGLDEKVRAQDLSLEKWVKLAEKIKISKLHV